MSTLIAVYNSEGCVGRCDAKCYEATSGPCDCICGGRNHGAGAQQATENTRELAQSWADSWRAQHPGESFDVELIGAQPGLAL